MNAAMMRTLLLGSLLTLLQACTSPPREQHAREAQLAQTQARLLRAGDADSLATAAVLMGGPRADAGVRLALLTRAVALAPDRIDLRWQALLACVAVASCDAPAQVAQLHARDPANAAAWWVLLKHAPGEGEMQAQQEALRAMAQSQRFDVYWTSSIAHLTRALLAVQSAGHGATALATIIGTEVVWWPPLRPLSEACQGTALAQADRLASCRAIAAVMRRADTYLVASLGDSLALRLWPEGSVEHADALAHRRIARYRMQASEAVLVDPLRSNAAALHYLALLGTHVSEQAVSVAVLEEAHRELLPLSAERVAPPG